MARGIVGPNEGGGFRGSAVTIDAVTQRRGHRRFGRVTTRGMFGLGAQEVISDADLEKFLNDNLLPPMGAVKPLPLADIKTAAEIAFYARDSFHRVVAVGAKLQTSAVRLAWARAARAFYLTHMHAVTSASLIGSRSPAELRTELDQAIALSNDARRMMAGSGSSTKPPTKPEDQKITTGEKTGGKTASSWPSRQTLIIGSVVAAAAVVGIALIRKKRK